jgi:hypothetical protein
MAIPSILSTALKLGGRVASSSAAKAAGSQVFRNLRDKAIEKAPGALWRAAGGHKVPILNAGFQYLDQNRIKQNQAASGQINSEQKKRESAQMNAWARSYKQSQKVQQEAEERLRSQARRNQQRAEKTARDEAAKDSADARRANKKADRDSRNAHTADEKQQRREQTQANRQARNDAKEAEKKRKQDQRAADKAVRDSARSSEQEQGREIRKQSARGEHEAANARGTGVLHRSNNGILTRIANDISEIKNILAKGGFGGGGEKEDSGGGLGDLVSDLVGRAAGKALGRAGRKGGRFILKGATKVASAARRGVGGLVKAAKRLTGPSANAAKKVLRWNGEKWVGKELATVGADVAKTGLKVVPRAERMAGQIVRDTIPLGFEGAAAASKALPAAAEASTALAKTAGTAGKVGLEASKGLVTTGAAAIAKSGAAEKAVVGKGIATAAKGLIGKEAIAGAAKIGGKGLAKSILKKIPALGLLAGIGFGIKRAIDGDWIGAGLEVASGAASLAPGFGTAASVGIDAALIARDVSGASDKASAPDAPTAPTAPKAGENLAKATPAAIKKAALTPSKPTVKAPLAAVTSNAGSTVGSKSPIQRAAEALEAMLSAMTDEKSGIFTKPAKDALDPTQMGENGPGIPEGQGGGGVADNSGGSGQALRGTLTPGMSTSRGSLNSEGSVTPTGNMGGGGRKAVDIPFAADGALPGMSAEQTKALAGDTAYTESRGNAKAENKYGYIGKYQFGADALSDQGLVDTDKLKSAKKASGDAWYKGGQTSFLNDDANWKNKGGKAGFLGDEKSQDDAYLKYTKKNVEAGYKSGALTASSSPEDIGAYAKAAHLKGVGGANKLFLHGEASTDANGTSTATYAAQARKAVAGAGKGDSSLINGGQSDKALAISRDPTQHADAITKQQNEVAASQQGANAPVVVPVPVPTQQGQQKTSGGGAGASGAMISRNPDSSIRNLTDATMRASVT